MYKDEKMKKVQKMKICKLFKNYIEFKPCKKATKEMKNTRIQKTHKM